MGGDAAWQGEMPAGILTSVRWPWVFAVAVIVSSATAEASVILRRRAPRPATPAPRVDFWREVLEPNGTEVAAIVANARIAMARPENAINGDTDWAVETRARFYRDAYNMLRHARTLSPQNLEVLALLGRAADELGRTPEAIEAFERCAELAGTDRIMTEVAGRLGAIYLRLGEHTTAVRWLRLVHGGLSAVTAPSLVYLANALAKRGEIAQAIDTLANALPAPSLGHYPAETTLASFSLAVIYDRDEQRGAAFSVLDRMQAMLGAQYMSYLQNELARLRFPDPADLYYYRGLLYESQAHYVEARAEWAHYAAITDAPWRARALDHIAAIDALRRHPPPAQVTP